jgi:zinc transporter ZupT
MGLALATYIALGIGRHNLGEGLAIGAAFAAGVAGLGVFLVLGFTLHNVTEGIGIAAPLTGARPSLLAFAGLALLAGGPAIPASGWAASAIHPTGLRSLWPSVPAPSCRSSSRLAPI